MALHGYQIRLRPAGGSATHGQADGSDGPRPPRERAPGRHRQAAELLGKWNIDMDVLAKVAWLQASEQGAHRWPTTRVGGPAWEVRVSHQWIQGMQDETFH